MIRIEPRAILAAFFALAVACGEPVADTPDAGEGEPDAGEPQVEAVCTDPVAVACEDQLVQDMNLQDTVAPGVIENTPIGTGAFLTHVDATAGGFQADPPQSFVYAKFTDTGLTKVELSDEDALYSMDWDIAFRRYIIVLNGGDSGPSCVGGTRLPPGTVFEDLAAAPADATWHLDDQYTDTCEFVPDGSGLPSSPATVLASFYRYAGCVQMTENVYAIRLADGRAIKVMITAYYYPDKQTYCQENDASPPAPTGSGNIHLEWAFLE